MKGNKNAKILVVWRVMGHLRSLATWQFDRAYTTSYLSFIETVHVSLVPFLSYSTFFIESGRF